MSAHWSSDELELLQSLVGDMPWHLVPQHYNRCAKAKGFTKRSEIAMRRICDKHRIQRRTTGEWITSGCVCQLLGISYSTVRRWIQAGWLPATRTGEGSAFARYFRRRDLRSLARSRPDLFGGQELATLIELLDNETLAQQIVDMELPKPWQPKAVICIETGRRFPSIIAAAKATYVTPQRMRVVIDHPTRTANDLHFKFA